MASEQELINKIKRAKFSMSYSKGGAFLLSLLCSTDVEISKNHGKTAATNGKVIWFHPEFLEKITDKQTIGVFAHELWHIALLHNYRIGNRNSMIWNCAADYVINHMLIKDDYELPEDILVDDAYAGMSSEEVYEILMKEVNSSKDLEDLINALAKILGQGQESDSSEQDSDKKGNGKGNSTDKKIPALSGDVIAGKQEDFKEVLAKVATATMTANQKDCGKLMGEVLTTINKFNKSIVPWDKVLDKFLTELAYDDRSYRRPSRRSNSFILPTMMGQSGLEHILYCVDVSGSISDEEIVQFNSEVRAIKNKFNPEKLTLILFDTHIRKEYVFTKDQPFNFVETEGRGGTDLEDVVAYANKAEPSAVIIFTDLYVNIPSTRIKKPVIWVVTTDEMKAPYGVTININNMKDAQF